MKPLPFVTPRADEIANQLIDDTKEILRTVYDSELHSRQLKAFAIAIARRLDALEAEFYRNDR